VSEDIPFGRMLWHRNSLSSSSAAALENLSLSASLIIAAAKRLALAI
jgi:hypothetical protein